jgi:UV DNA damage endonuclease
MKSHAPLESSAPRIGYACISLAVPGAALSSCTLRSAAAAPGRLRVVAAANLRALETAVAYNRREGIRLYRISSDLIPLATHPSRPIDLDDALSHAFAADLARIGAAARDADLRLSMHPGQYTVLNSPSPEVVARAVDDLAYHAAVLDALGAGGEARVVLHVGGGYGDREAAMERFVQTFRRLPEAVSRRIVLENDDRVFTPADVLAVATSLSIPAVYDNLHAALNPSTEGGDDALWTSRFASTWRPGDGAQKIHYSQQAPDRRDGSHSDTILADPFLAHLEALRAGLPFGTPLPDIMLEVKDKNLSAVKANLLAGSFVRPDARGMVRRLETEWARYKYAVLARSERDYDAIRQLLKDKAPEDLKGFVLAFYRTVEQAFDRPEDPGAEANAAQHVWGYFKKTSTPSARRRFENLLVRYRDGQASAVQLRALLSRFADREGERYLQEGYYFLG